MQYIDSISLYCQNNYSVADDFPPICKTMHNDMNNESQRREFYKKVI